MVHRLNLVVQNLSSMLMASKLEDFFQLFYGSVVLPHTILNPINLLKL
jgi:hypothetical protein